MVTPVTLQAVQKALRIYGATVNKGATLGVSPLLLSQAVQFFKINDLQPLLDTPSEGFVLQTVAIFNDVCPLTPPNVRSRIQGQD